MPPGYRAEPGHQARWLWRTLRAAELAGLASIRASAEAAAHRGQHVDATRHRVLAASYRDLHDAYRQREAVFAAVMAGPGRGAALSCGGGFSANQASQQKQNAQVTRA